MCRAWTRTKYYCGRINQYLTNIRWYGIVSGVKTLIASDNAGYEITKTGGDNAGRMVKKNAVQEVTPITLQFYAEYIDTRTNQLHVVQGTHQLICDNSTVYMPVLSLNASDTTIYKPANGFRHADRYRFAKTGYG